MVLGPFSFYGGSFIYRLQPVTAYNVTDRFPPTMPYFSHYDGTVEHSQFIACFLR